MECGEKESWIGSQVGSIANLTSERRIAIIDFWKKQAGREAVSRCLARFLILVLVAVVPRIAHSREGQDKRRQKVTRILFAQRRC